MQPPPSGDKGIYSTKIIDPKEGPFYTKIEEIQKSQLI